jgi:hypothetical protein
MRLYTFAMEMPLSDGPNIGAQLDRMSARPCASVIPL